MSQQAAISLIAALVLPSLAFAQLNTTSSSTADERVGWVSSSGRSTGEILWSCFSVLLVCSWKCVHLNIPTREERWAGWHKWRRIPYWPERPLLRKWRRRVMWMGIIVLAPEIGVSLAVQQYIAAVTTRNKVGGDWTMAHAFYANMGGFEMHISPSDKSFSLNADNLASLKRQRPKLFPAIKENSIQGWAKADSFTKAFALGQSIWLLAQSIARELAGLPITELELATMAFSVCALAMYIFWWDKPFDIEYVTIIEWLEEMEKNLTLSGEPLVTDRASNMTLDDFIDILYRELLDLWDGDHWYGKEVARSLAFYATSTVFSAIHIIAWNWDFPSSTIRLMWRSFSIAATCAPLLPFPLFLISNLLSGYVGGLVFEKFARLLIYCSIILSLFGYVVSRVALIVLIFYCFSSMPSGVYSTINVDWIKGVPHFS